MPKEYKKYEDACKYRKKDEITIFDIHIKRYKNIKIVRELKPYEYEVDMPG